MGVDKAPTIQYDTNITRGNDMARDAKDIRALLRLEDEKTGMMWNVVIVERLSGLPTGGLTLFVEFYDAEHEKTWENYYGLQLGQSVSSYYAETLRDHNRMLDLCGHEPAWKVGARLMTEVCRVLHRMSDEAGNLLK